MLRFLVRLLIEKLHRQRRALALSTTVIERGSEIEAQAVLEQRQKRVAHLNIRRLSPTERDHYTDAWRMVQSRFIEDPKGALIEADDTVISVMKAEGYPISDFAQRVPNPYFVQRAADLSVDHPNVVQKLPCSTRNCCAQSRGPCNQGRLATGHDLLPVSF